MRRLLEMALVVLSLQLCAAGASLVLSPTPATAQLMTATDGALSELAIQFHRMSADRFLPVYEQLLKELSPDVAIRVVVSDAEDEAIFRAALDEWFADGPQPVVTFSHTGRPITSWMRDRLAVLPTTQGKTRLLAPAMPMTGPEVRAHDWTVPWTLGEQLGPDVALRRSQYRFDGGDLIADERFTYVASPLFARNPDLPKATLTAMLTRDLGRPVLALTDTPDHHLGMFLTPLGNGTVVVADPNLARQLLADSDIDAASIQVGGAPAGEPSAQLLRQFDNVIEQLEGLGLDVVHMPVLPTSQHYAWLSYNNVLSERRDGQLHVYLPVYDVPALDDAATAIWQEEGAIVHPIRVDGLFRLGGSVRCLTAPITRS